MARDEAGENSLAEVVGAFGERVDLLLGLYLREELPLFLREPGLVRKQEIFHLHRHPQLLVPQQTPQVLLQVLRPFLHVCLAFHVDVSPEVLLRQQRDYVPPVLLDQFSLQVLEVAEPPGHYRLVMLVSLLPAFDLVKFVAFEDVFGY